MIDFIRIFKTNTKENTNWCELLIISNAYLLSQVINKIDELEKAMKNIDLFSVINIK